MDNLIKDFEQSKIKEHKKSYVDVQKQLNQDQMHALSKTKQKKFENTILQNFSQTNSTMGVSLSLDNAIMYMQNVLSTIEHKVQNEIRYSLNFKQIVAKQIARLDITQQTFYEDIAHFTNLEQTAEQSQKEQVVEQDEAKATIFNVMSQ